jgi:pimeloyl-ACP methyl ester carboxylesterase
MAKITANGVQIHHELHGEGVPLVLVHGSWVDSSSWAGVVPLLAGSFQVLVYDRRGHSRSERPTGKGSVHEDAEDLGALIDALDLGPAHVVTSSYGGNIALRLAAKRPELFRSLASHEPPLVGLLAGDPDSEPLLAGAASTFEAVGGRIATGDHEGAARRFVEEVALGPGGWNQLPPGAREVMVHNAPTFLDEIQDADQTMADAEALAALEMPVLFTDGSAGSPMFERVADRLAEIVPTAARATIRGAAHAPHLDAPEAYAATIRAFAPGRIPQPA